MDLYIDALNLAANNFIDVVKDIVVSKEVYENGWNAKHIIAHIVFYHEYYVNVVKALVDKKELPLIDESLAKVNLKSANDYSKMTRNELIKRFETAHKLFVNNLIKLNSDTLIPYKKGGRIYKRDEYIEEISRHIARHTKDLVKK